MDIHDPSVQQPPAATNLSLEDRSEIDWLQPGCLGPFTRRVRSSRPSSFASLHPHNGFAAATTEIATALEG